MSMLPPERQGGDDRGQRGPSGPPPPSRWFWTAFIISAIAIAGFVAYGLLANKTTPAPTSIPYSTFLTDVGHGTVKSVDINQSKGKVDGVFANGTSFTTQGPTGTMPPADVQLLDEHKVARNYVAPSSSSSIWPSLIFVGALIGLVGLFLLWSSRRTRGQMAGFTSWSKSGAKVHTTERPSTTFADIAGYGSVKEELGEVVDFLRNPQRFRSIGARVPKGVLLVGPPGTGKTLFARGVAGEAQAPFITVTGSEFMEMFVGVGAARVRDLFNTARQQRPAIIFVDEIDAIGRKRGTGLGGGHDEREQTLNQLLAEMDGFEAQEGIVILAATNRPDILDPALLRAGRFDRQVVIPLPSLEERLAILHVHTRSKRVASDADLDVLARGTPGMSGAELENLVNEAALVAVRRGSPEIAAEDLEAARDRVVLGLKRSSLVLTPEEKRIVAYHESGHALLAELLPNADRVHKVTILPAGMALGATQQLPAEDRQLLQRPALDDALAVRLGGRAAEELVFGLPSTGAEDDLTSATSLAARMVREWGMSDKIGKMAWGPRGPVFLGEELMHTREYSDETARVIDQEVSRILDEQAARARQALNEHRAALDGVARALLLQETLDGALVHTIIDEVEHPRPATPLVNGRLPALAAAGQKRTRPGSPDPHAGFAAA